MTGGQDSSATGSLYNICTGVGVSEAHIKTIIPLKKNLEENISIFKNEFEYDGVSVILATRECIQTLKRKKKRSNNA